MSSNQFFLCTLRKNMYIHKVIKNHDLLDWLNFEELERNENLPLSLHLASRVRKLSFCTVHNLRLNWKFAPKAQVYSHEGLGQLKIGLRLAILKPEETTKPSCWASNVAVNEKFATGFDTATLRGFKLSR